MLVKIDNYLSGWFNPPFLGHPNGSTHPGCEATIAFAAEEALLVPRLAVAGGNGYNYVNDVSCNPFPQTPQQPW